MTGYMMHKNYNSCLPILDMHVERGRHQCSHRKQILVIYCLSERTSIFLQVLWLLVQRQRFVNPYHAKFGNLVSK